ncbi:MAG TPA: DUF6572 domain-containing protein [Xanthobacteraceae bacterium]|nr:DUF6572 domain-containing protein [Xanthobacteraceae bacterium]
MSLDNIRVIDAASTTKDGTTVVLNILDSWDWHDPHEHLYALQEKINAYLEFVGSGQIYEDYPNASGRILRIDILSRFPMPKEGLAFLKEAAAIVAKFNIALTQKVI